MRGFKKIRDPGARVSGLEEVLIKLLYDLRELLLVPWDNHHGKLNSGGVLGEGAHH